MAHFKKIKSHLWLPLPKENNIDVYSWNMLQAVFLNLRQSSNKILFLYGEEMRKLSQFMGCRVVKQYLGKRNNFAVNRWTISNPLLSMIFNIKPKPSQILCTIYGMCWNDQINKNDISFFNIGILTTK